MKNILLTTTLLSTIIATAQPNAAVTANNSFAFRYFTQLDKKTGKNFCVSPYSISSAFAMTYAGAAGETQKEFQKVFGFGANDSTFHSAFGKLNTSLLKNNNSTNTFSIANRLFPQQGMAFEKDFLGITKRFYTAQPEPLDYGQFEASREHINTWVEDQTHQRIKDLLPEGSITVDTRLVLVNALYMKCKWANGFKKENTTEQPFYGDKGKTEKVKLMSQELSAAYYSDKRIKAVELPYKDSELSMVIVMPSETQQPLDSIRSYFSEAKYNEMVSKMYYTDVNLLLPKFKTEFSTSLKNDLTKMGMPYSFSALADFSKMTKSAHLFISDAFHKTFVEVDEEGTEAAAATAVVMNVDSAVAVIPQTFRADRPFIYLIRDRSTGAILFFGEMHSPAAE